VERGGACFTPIEQGDDGDCFGGGGVVWRSAVVMVLGWLPAATKGGEEKEKDEVISCEGGGLGLGYYTRIFHFSPLGFLFPILATNIFINSELFLIGFPVTRLPVHKSIQFSSTIHVHVIIDFPTTLPEKYRYVRKT
jgi:hypothetical protein